MTEDRNNEPEDRWVEFIQSEQQRNKALIRVDRNRELWNSNGIANINIMEGSEGEEKQ